MLFGKSIFPPPRCTFNTIRSFPASQSIFTSLCTTTTPYPHLSIWVSFPPTPSLSWRQSSLGAIPFGKSLVTTMLFTNLEAAHDPLINQSGPASVPVGWLHVRSPACFTHRHSSKNSDSNQIPEYPKSRWALRKMGRKIISVSNNTSVLHVNTWLVKWKCRVLWFSLHYLGFRSSVRSPSENCSLSSSSAQNICVVNPYCRYIYKIV